MFSLSLGLEGKTLAKYLARRDPNGKLESKHDFVQFK